MNEWAGLFLAIMALTALVQCGFVIVAVRSLRSSGERISELCQRFDSEIKPTLDDLRKGASNLRAISDSGREQALRVEQLLSTTLGTVEGAIENVRSLVAPPLESLAELRAFWGGLRRGVDTYRASEPKRRAPPGPSRRAEDADEHLFIG